MRHSLIPLVFLSALASVAHAEAKPRFSTDAIALFEELTQAYDLNGKRMPAGKFDEATIARLQKSKEKEVADVAERAPMLRFLNQLSKQQNKQVGESFETQAKLWPGIIAGHVIQALRSPETEQNDLRGAAKLLEDLMGSNRKDSPQQAVNRAWATACLGNGLGISMRETMRTLANRPGPAGGELKSPIAITANTDQLGAITLTNRTGRALHHCLIFTRLEQDVERIKKMAAEEDLVGVFILPSLGFSKQTVEGSRDAAKLRHHFNAQDKGVMVYVAEIPANGTLTTQLARPDYYQIAKGADMSIWCDELAIDHQSAENWSDAHASVEKALKRPASKGGLSIPKKGERVSGPNPDPKSKDLFYKGSVWRGRSIQTQPRTAPQDIEVVVQTRDSEKFTGEMFWNGRHLRDIAGTVAEGKIQWAAAPGERNKGHENVGTIKDSRVEIKFSGPIGKKNVEGTLTLDYVPLKK